MSQLIDSLRVLGNSEPATFRAVEDWVRRSNVAWSMLEYGMTQGGTFGVAGTCLRMTVSTTDQNAKSLADLSRDAKELADLCPEAEWRLDETQAKLIFDVEYNHDLAYQHEETARHFSEVINEEFKDITHRVNYRGGAADCEVEFVSHWIRKTFCDYHFLANIEAGLFQVVGLEDDGPILRKVTKQNRS